VVITIAQYYSLFLFSSACSSIKMAAAVIKLKKRGLFTPALFYYVLIIFAIRYYLFIYYFVLFSSLAALT
jgi:hypothetical protein